MTKRLKMPILGIAIGLIVALWHSWAIPFIWAFAPHDFCGTSQGPWDFIALPLANICGQKYQV